MSRPNEFQLRALSEAVPLLSKKDIDTYLSLRRSLRSRATGFEGPFREKFAQHYRLNSAGLTDEFKQHYFDLLFSLRLQEGVDPYTPILKSLYEFTRRKGDKALQCSFASKLVAIHDETRPIFDIYVQNFFGMGVPKGANIGFRIAGFVENLAIIRATYRSWAQSTAFEGIVAQARARYPQLADCTPERIADFLIWTGGKSGKQAVRSTPALEDVGSA